MGLINDYCRSVGSSIVWTPKIAEYLDVNEVPDAQWYIAGVVFVELKSIYFGAINDTAQQVYDSYRFTFDYHVAAIDEAYDSYGSAPDAG